VMTRVYHGNHSNGDVNGDGLRVLVVEDNADSATSLALLLRLQGHEVKIALDGPTGLQVAQDNWPDVVLLDIGLPGLDGYLVARGIGEHPGEKKPLLIAVTGYDRETDRQRSAEAGIDLHLVKPVDPVQLQGLLGRFRTIIR
jgi:CheY-like chemotaxis protein